ncbi:outer membrane immunogenic protein [Rhizobium sp. BIGb0125]|jgi:outer membrane immunogenic protein|uniref:outer membrane protein n=1 Tax=Rhizobium/Agrobacterium group TaxID=227290 RepID=UPI002166FFA6|nr:MULTISPECIES: outer membrane protein [Rhizobium/Agrobacterium group]MCS4242617.1 outer membrane immunogenic protein [Rhizobium sp. BIGb0125]MDO5895647.1 porin family protein [Agrobacterium sp. Azo12]
MKKLALSAAFILAASSAMAADAVYEVPAAPVAVELPGFNWTGFTVGVQGGYGWNNHDLDFGAGAPFPAFAADFDGGILGGFVGYNHQMDNNWVLGIEGDFEKNWGDDSLALGFGGPSINYGLDWQGSVRGRVGYAVDRALIYGTAGWAIGRGFAEVPGFVAEQKETFNGFTVGAGVDYAFTDNVFGRVEYRYTNFGDKDFTFGGLGGGTVNSDLDQHAIRIGLGIKF